MLKNPDNPGTYTVIIFEMENDFVLGKFSLLVK
jgi:hypothetical protein